MESVSQAIKLAFANQDLFASHGIIERTNLQR